MTKGREEAFEEKKVEHGKETVISAKDLSIGYHTSKGDKLVRHLSLQLFAGELTCLLGANGTGKSTLLRTLSASQHSTFRRTQILGKPLNSYTERERSAPSVSY